MDLERGSYSSLDYDKIRDWHKEIRESRQQNELDQLSLKGALEKDAALARQNLANVGAMDVQALSDKGHMAREVFKDVGETKRAGMQFGPESPNMLKARADMLDVRKKGSMTLENLAKHKAKAYEFALDQLETMRDPITKKIKHEFGDLTIDQERQLLNTLHKNYLDSTLGSGRGGKNDDVPTLSLVTAADTKKPLSAPTNLASRTEPGSAVKASQQVFAEDSAVNARARLNTLLGIDQPVPAPQPSEATGSLKKRKPLRETSPLAEWQLSKKRILQPAPAPMIDEGITPLAERLKKLRKGTTYPWIDSLSSLTTPARNY